MNRRTPVKLVVLDYDGLLVDTETPYWKAWTAEFLRVGIELSPAQWAAIMRSNTDPSLILRSKHGIAIGAHRRDQINQDVLTTIGEAGAMPGVLDLLHRCQVLGWQLALVTNASPRWLAATMPAELHPFLDSRITNAGKPSASAFHSVLRRHQVQPEETVGLDDSPRGVTALVAAGITTLYVPSPPYKATRVEGVERAETLHGITPEHLSGLTVATRLPTPETSPRNLGGLSFAP